MPRVLPTLFTIALGILTLSPESKAGPPTHPPASAAPAPPAPPVPVSSRFITHWSFEADYLPTGQGNQDEDGTKTSPVPMPEQFPWACMREPVRSDSHGVLIGGWECRSGTSQIFIRALCYPDQPDMSNGQAGLSATDDQRLVHLSVWCQTKEKPIIPGATPGNTF